MRNNWNVGGKNRTIRRRINVKKFIDKADNKTAQPAKVFAYYTSIHSDAFISAILFLQLYDSTMTAMRPSNCLIPFSQNAILSLWCSIKNMSSEFRHAYGKTTQKLMHPCRIVAPFPNFEMHGVSFSSCQNVLPSYENVLQQLFTIFHYVTCLLFLMITRAKWCQARILNFYPSRSSTPNDRRNRQDASICITHPFTSTPS